MSDRPGMPPTRDRLPGRRPALWFPVLLALVTLLLALPAVPIARAQTETLEIANGGGSATLQGVTITNRSENTCDFTVTRSTEPPGGGLPDLGEIRLQWDISSSGCGDLLVDLFFEYTQQDLQDGNSVYESGLHAFRYDTGTWVDQCSTTCVYPSDDEVRVQEVTQLGDWTIADLGVGYPGPATVTLRGSAQGASFDESALVLGLSVLTGVGLILGWRLRKPAG
jgi:hypothetical protein